MNIEYDYSKLRGKIKEVFNVQSSFANELGISSVSLSSKLNNSSEFTQSEILKSSNLLGISKNEISEYFFVQKV